MSIEGSELNGLLLVDKPGLDTWRAQHPHLAADVLPDPRSLPTSHDVVQRVRRWSHQRRIGHTGTLDPMASGLLVLCLGRATRLVEYYQGHDKRYQAEVTLGFTTDTYDALGSVAERAAIPRLGGAQIETALAGLRGPQMQQPPLYSALKQGGESLHYKARRGESVEVAARPVVFHALTLLDWLDTGRIVLDVRCSAGAYIRTLAVDLGRALGTVATLTALRRLESGPFELAHGHTLDSIESAAEEDALAGMLLAPGTGLELPVIRADAESTRRLGCGQVVPIAESENVDSAADLAQYVDAQGALLGLVRRIRPQEPAAPPALWKAEKWFA